MQVQPYLFFDGRCEEALEFYSKNLGAVVTAKMRFSEAPPLPEGEQNNDCGGMPPGAENKIMHAAFNLGDSMILASDGMNGGQPKFEGVSLALSLSSDSETERVFTSLADGGQVQMPLSPMFWTSSFGMVADKFGVSWMVMTESCEQA